MKVVIAIFAKQSLPKRNVTYERRVFRKEAQRSGETTDAFATRLRGLVTTCEYGPLQVRDQNVDNIGGGTGAYGRCMERLKPTVGGAPGWAEPFRR